MDPKFFIPRSSSAIAHQLSILLPVVSKIDHAKNLLYILGFSPPSLAETIAHTSRLHHLLRLASSRRQKFILVISSTSSPLHSVALSLTDQFARKHNLDYIIYNVDPRTDPLLAARQIAKSLAFHPRPPVRKPAWLVGVKLVALLVVMPWVAYSLQLLLAYRLFYCGWDLLRAGNWQASQLCSQVAGGFSRAIAAQTPFVIGAQPLLDRAGISLPVLGQLAPPLADSLFWASVVGEQLTTPPPLNTANINHALARLAESLAYLQVHTQADPVVPARIAVNHLQLLLPEVFAAFSSVEPATYLVLVQDNTRLRPTGGILNLLAFVTLQSGKVSHVEFHPVAGLDAKLLGQVDPPPDFVAATGALSWHLQDSTWDPDVTVSAQKAAWFVSKILARPVNGVWVTNLSQLPSVLEITGPVKVGDSLVSSQSFLAGTAPGPEFVFSTLQGIQAKLSQLDRGQSLRLIRLAYTSLVNRQTFFVPRPSSNRVNRLGWDGGLVAPACRTTACLADLVYVVDSTVSPGHIDTLIKRQISLQSTLTPGQISSRLQISYFHTGTGVYQNYLRIYLPATAKIVQSTPPEPTTAFRSGLAEIALPIKLLPQARTEVTLVYTQDHLPRSNFRYQLDILNQPGNPADLAVTLSYPSTWQTKSSLPPLVADGGQIQYNSTLRAPFFLGIDIATQTQR